MSELRRDPITGRWNIIVTEQPAGPEAFDVELERSIEGECPFCVGREGMTPNELYAVRPEGSPADGPGWQLRVVPNKFPALEPVGEPWRKGLGMFDQCNGIGSHEVIIETADHHKELLDLTLPEVEQVIAAYQRRMLDLRGDRRLRYSLVFKNVGVSAGATLEHAHSQLIALPIVPKRVREELVGAQRYFEFRDRCGYCDMLHQELHEDERIVCENRSFVAWCPFVSSFPFEVLILPKEHRAHFPLIQDTERADFARILKETLMRTQTVLRNPSYNFILHTAPVEIHAWDAYHWHLELTPRLIQVAGFEWGTGFYINPTPPELAATYLRDVSIPNPSKP